jgi:hypothetical protein
MKKNVLVKEWGMVQAGRGKQEDSQGRTAGQGLAS